MNVYPSEKPDQAGVVQGSAKTRKKNVKSIKKRRVRWRERHRERIAEFMIRSRKGKRRRTYEKWRELDADYEGRNSDFIDADCKHLYFYAAQLFLENNKLLLNKSYIAYGKQTIALWKIKKTIHYVDAIFVFVISINQKQ